MIWFVGFGFLLVHFSLLLVLKATKFKSRKLNYTVNTLLFLMLLFYIILHPITLAGEFFAGEDYDLILNYIVIFFFLLFSPYFWFSLIYLCSKMFLGLKINKKAKVRGDIQYYRNDLSQYSPSLIAFISNFKVNIRSCVSSSLLKLKLEGFLTEKDGILSCTGKKILDLVESEKMLIRSVQANQFDEKRYRKAIEDESINHELIKKFKTGLVGKLIKILMTFVFTFLFIAGSIFLLDYIDRIYTVLHVFTEIAVIVLLPLILISIPVAVALVISQIKSFKSSFKRTIKGNLLVNKAYGLRNFLRDYSIIKDRTADELVLWEYYLIYAVALDVNVNIEDEIISKFINSIIP